VETSESIEIFEAHRAEHLPVIRELFREYSESIEVDLCFLGFAEELAGLPGKYAPPAGRLLLARVGAAPAGSVALRALEAGIAELKRLYVRPEFRRHGLGRMLTERILEAARQIGYSRVRLDTLGSMKPAIALYESLGFRRIAPYYHNPSACAVFMELGFEPVCPESLIPSGKALL
jgi:putative acetyltransferase